MILGVISDTHDDIESLKAFIKAFKEKDIGTVFHLGDYVAPPTVKLFKGLRLVGVFGNNDGYKQGLIKTFSEIGGELLGDFGETEAGGLKIALYHGEFEQISESLAREGRYDIVFTGHLHKFEARSFNGTALLSPGSAHKSFSTDGGPVAAIFDTDDKSFSILRL
jgi:uncharacterized protein